MSFVPRSSKIRLPSKFAVTPKKTTKSSLSLYAYMFNWCIVPFCSMIYMNICVYKSMEKCNKLHIDLFVVVMRNRTAVLCLAKTNFVLTILMTKLHIYKTHIIFSRPKPLIDPHSSAMLPIVFSPIHQRRNVRAANAAHHNVTQTTDTTTIEWITKSANQQKWHDVFCEEESFIDARFHHLHEKTETIKKQPDQSQTIHRTNSHIQFTVRYSQ